MSRKRARDNAFKLIFEIPFYNNEAEIRIENYIQNMDKNVSGNDLKYLKAVAETCFNNLKTIDDALNLSLKKWTVSRLPNVTVAILRLALCEMLYFDDIPYQVSINEAIELAKIYGDDDAPSFINGVLANHIKDN